VQRVGRVLALAWAGVGAVWRRRLVHRLEARQQVVEALDRLAREQRVGGRVRQSDATAPVADEHSLAHGLDDRPELGGADALDVRRPGELAPGIDR
jgi:hypothetical protein